MNGIPLARISKDKDMPGLTRIYKEISNNKDFSKQIQECRKIGAQSYIEKAMEELDKGDKPSDDVQAVIKDVATAAAKGFED